MGPHLFVALRVRPSAWVRKVRSTLYSLSVAVGRDTSNVKRESRGALAAATQEPEVTNSVVSTAFVKREPTRIAHLTPRRSSCRPRNNHHPFRTS